jgi:transposase
VNQDQQRGQSRHRPRYDKEFKRNAVELLESGERSAVQLGRELGVSDCSLGKWKRQYGWQGQGARSGVGADVPRGRGRERRRGRERLGKRRTGTNPAIAGIVCLKSDRSIGSALRQHARTFPYRFLLACFPPQSSSSSFPTSAFGFAQRVVGAALRDLFTLHERATPDARERVPTGY